MEINRGFKFVKLKIKCRYIHYKRQGFAALSFNNCLTRREQEIPLFYKWWDELRLTRRFLDFWGLLYYNIFINQSYLTERA